MPALTRLHPQMFEGMNNKRKGIEIDPMTGLEVPKELEVYEPPYLARVGRRIEGSVRPTTPAHIAQCRRRSSPPFFVV